jgi:hypothetical protein
VVGAGVGLPFSDKKIIPRNTKQDGTDVSSVGFRLFRGKENLEIPFRTISGKRKTIPFQTIFNDKTLEFLPEPFSEEKTSEFCSEPFSEEKKLGIPFRSIFGRENTCKSVPNHFWEQKTLEKR